MHYYLYSIRTVLYYYFGNLAEYDLCRGCPALAPYILGHPKIAKIYGESLGLVTNGRAPTVRTLQIHTRRHYSGVHWRIFFSFCS